MAYLKKFNSKKRSVLAVIPARGGSKRILNKNTKKFAGASLIVRTVKQALECSFVDRTIVDTDSARIAAIAKKAGAEVLWLRPKYLARNNTRVVDSLLYLLAKLAKEEKYIPDYILLLQTTSPLRTVADIEDCWSIMQTTDASTVLTITPTHPKLYRLKSNKDIVLVNGSERFSSNTQEWKQAYILNGCFVYLIKTAALKKEKLIITKRTKAMVCPKWRSIDLDTPEEWVLGELIYRHKKEIERKIKNFK